LTRGRQRPLEGPERPTFIERAISAIPLPYAVSCFLLAALAQTPGLFLVNLVDTGDLDRAVQATFPEIATVPPTFLAFGAAFGVGFYTLLLYLIRYSRQGLLSSRDDIVPLLPDGESGFRRIYGILHAPVPILAIAALLAAFFLFIGTRAAVLTPLHILFIAIQLAVVSLGTGTVLWSFAVTLWGLRRLGKEPLRLRPYTEDPMLGLRPLGTMSVSATMVYFGMVAVVVVVSLLSPQSPAYLSFLLALLVLGVLMFVLPLLGIHQKMLEEKRKVERALAEQATREWKAMEVAPPTADASLAELRGLVVSLREFVAHERAERKVASLPTWPFDPQVTGRIAAITLTGVIAVLGRAAVDYFLVRP